MDPTRWRRIEELFADSLGVATAERDAFLAAQCGDDAALEREVRSLLANAEPPPADDRLRATIASAVDDYDRAVAAPLEGTRVGPYRLADLLGEGGMGRVYLAERVDGTYEQKVAIKVLQHQVATPQLVARFRDERQILAGLEHPGIVRLIDGGSTDDGLPYLVMEHVRGIPLTRYVRDRPVRERIALVVEIAGAIQHAHQRLIVHRDIKPNNILVDEAGRPKLLDFGIAKLLEPTAATADATATGMALLTPEYASPEQARGEPVSVATDVYALGAVLYELLTGQPPQHGRASVLETLHAICHVDPPRPRISGDLDSIVLKALQKDPAQRYPSIAAMAADLESYLDGRPVTAREASARYRATKFVSRNRGKLAIATVVAGALVAATVVSMRAARRADRQAALAARTTARLFAERGWQELEAQHYGRALDYLKAARERGNDTAAVRFMMAEAARPSEHARTHVPFDAGVIVMAWSPDGRHVALGGFGGVHVYDAAGALEADLAIAPTDAVFRVRFTSDSTRVAAVSSDGHVRVWAIGSGALVLDVAAPPSPRYGAGVGDMVLTADDRAVVYAELDGRLVVRDLSSRGPRLALPVVHEGERISAVAVSADGTRAAAGTDRGRIAVVDLERGAVLADLTGHTSAISVLRFLRDGRLVSSSSDHTARIWSLAAGTAPLVLAAHNQLIENLDVDDQERMIVTSGRDGAASLWDAHTGAFLIQLRGHTNAVRNAHFDPSGTRVVTTGGDGTFAVWDVASGALEIRLEAPASIGRASSVAGPVDARFSRDGTTILAAASDGATFFAADRAPLIAAFASDGQARSAAFSPDETRVASVGTGVQLWDVASETLVATLPRTPQDLLWDLTWSPDGRRIVTAGNEHVIVWDVEHGRAERQLEGHSGRVNRASFNHAGTQIATASSDQTARIWDASDGRLVATLAHPRPVLAAAWSHDDRRLLTACFDGTIRVWDVASSRVVAEIPTTLQPLDATWSHDERQIAVGGRGGEIEVYELATRHRRAQLVGHTGPVTGVVWSPDDQLLASAADDQSARIWDIDTGLELARRPHHNTVMAIAWSRDGTRLLTASADELVRIWDVHRFSAD